MHEEELELLRETQEEHPPLPEIQGEVLILGPGRLGQHLALGVAALGLKTRLHGRGRVVKIPGVVSTAGELKEEVIKGSGLIILAISDASIEGVAESLARDYGPFEGVVVMHTSGQKNSESLRALKDAGAVVGSFHPLQSFSLPPKAGTFDGVFFAVEGEPEAQALGASLAKALGGWSRSLSPEAKVTYHASAVVASNLLIALADAAVEIAGQAGLEPNDALEMLLPLMEGSLKNLRGVGLPHSLTGPISRGDVKVVEAHLKALLKSPELLTIYRTLSKRAVDIARKQGLSSPEDLCQAASLLRNVD